MWKRKLSNRLCILVALNCKYLSWNGNLSLGNEQDQIAGLNFINSPRKKRASCSIWCVLCLKIWRGYYLKDHSTVICVDVCRILMQYIWLDLWKKRSFVVQYAWSFLCLTKLNGFCTTSICMLWHSWKVLGVVSCWYGLLLCCSPFQSPSNLQLFHVIWCCLVHAIPFKQFTWIACAIDGDVFDEMLRIVHIDGFSD